jgi:uncharacterized protein
MAVPMPAVAGGRAALALVAALTLLPPPAPAQQLEPRPFPQVGVRSYRIQSAATGRAYDVSVAVPAGYEARPDARFPALVVTDGNRMFPMVHGLVSMLSAPDAGEVEPLVVVSVGTPFELGDTAWVRRRIHEFSPPGWPMTDPFGRVVRSVCQTRQPRVPQAECTGGAPRFLEFLARELLPAVGAAYRIDPARVGLFGVSAGGFFAAWALFQEASPFRTYLISSPAMAYGDGEVERLEAAWAAAHRDLPARVYLGTGSLEVADPFLEGVGRIASGHARLAALLAGRAYPGLVLHSEIHTGLGHADAAAATLARGLRLLYATAPGAR